MRRGETVSPRRMRVESDRGWFSALLRDLGDQAHRRREGFELVVRSEIGDRLVITGFALDRADFDVRVLKRLPGLGGLAHVFRVGHDVIADPAIEPGATLADL